MDIATVCRSGGEYRPEHANNLARQVWKHCKIRLSVLTDFDAAEFDPVVEVIKTRRPDWSGWWSKIELFEVWTGQPVLYMDLDTVVTGNCSHIFSQGPLMMLADVYRRGHCGSGVMTWAADYSRIAQDFERRSETVMREYVTRHAWGDQAYIQALIGRQHANRIQDAWPGQVISFKADVMRRGAKGARIVYFHGKPRPWDADLKRYGIDQGEQAHATTDTTQ